MHRTQRLLLQRARDGTLSGLSLREMGRLIDVNVPQAIKHHLSQLETKGLIQWNRGDKEIRPVGATKTGGLQLAAVPVLGVANAGVPLALAEENLEGFLQISPRLLPNKSVDNFFAVRIEGDSMNRAKINGNSSLKNGDYAIIDASIQAPDTRDYVLAVIDGAGTVKRFTKDEENNSILLHSDSTKNYLPIALHTDELNDFVINGKVVGVVRGDADLSGIEE